MKKKIFKSVILKRKNKSIAKKDFYIFRNELSKKINNAYYYILKDIYILPDGTILSSNCKIIIDYLKINSISRFKLLKTVILLIIYLKKFISIYLFPRKNHIIEKAYIIHDRHSKNYFHWVCDVLPKICLGKNILDKKCSVVLPQYETKFQRESLKLLGIKRIISLHNKTILIKKAIYISELYPSGNPRTAIFKSLKKKIKKKVLFDRSKKRKIYISRRFALRRNLINEDIFEQKLKLIGFEIHNFQNYKFSKQVKIASEARIMLGISGAGLTNLIWMPAGSKIIDIRPKDQSLNTFFVMADLFKIKYYYYWVKSQYLLGSSTHSNYKLNFNVFFNKFIKEKI
jgi:capsular polysaccharide biosynthesis protein